ncbi:hypothetical protein ACWT_7248 [Actinoplanes sp. SE50]|uniref:PKD domain-containing protein n=1 Tax=unclassified Actinoplanes TaxID=2626549 RepID=UPI00023EDF11|nr:MULTISPECIES: PKD domain-containing protein [unclassified Actinoplanes]AEV88258.1 hypothetical protein ACPL_7378 [Actinoplanes sp. SE50/110]ATO86663.1 hypothetical protein ACWT_7248 [Actinoplanes sp. SE50]SLM04081.1 hypothetical protein ACSP50_7383 [Actinoplanes sp. SE50/110]
MKSHLARWSLAAGVTLAVIAPLAGSAAATVIAPPTPRDGRLTQVGPIAEHGFPAWYRDSTGARLEPCTTLDDPLCAVLPTEVPNADLPVSYPDNFPGEFFYQLADATLTLTDGTKATIGLNVEGAWANNAVIPGDQMVFGRVRIRFAAAAGRRFRITHPYGIDDLTADDKGVRMTEDAGAIPGAFGSVLNGRVGPFLKWDPAVAPAAPIGYIGDPGVTHPVVGSPYGTNFVRIEELDPQSGAVLGQVGFTDQFTVQGRYATNAGVDVDQATFTSGPDGSGAVEVYATSEPGQAIEIAANPALGIRGTRLRGSGNGRYYGRFAVAGPLPAGASVEIVNASDRPVARKTRRLVDVVQITEARYDADAQTLTVAATSSDRDAQPGVLSVAGYGPITGQPFTGVLAAPATVTVNSSSGGAATASLLGSGAGFGPARPVAGATTDASPVAGQVVKLDGTGSTGEIDAYSWTQTAGPAVTLTGSATATASFVAATPGTYTFSLTVSGPGGQSLPTAVTVTVVPAAKPVAVAGADQTVLRGKVVALDGSASTGAESYSWKQISGPAVTLAGASSAKPTFTFPAQALPAAPGPNAGFVFDNDPVVLELTATNPNGTATSRITVRPQAETFPGGVTARYRTGNNEWRITGTSSLIAGQRITAVLGDTLTGRVIGTSPVDAAGAYSIRVTGPAPGAVRTISVVTTVGGRQLAVAVTITN